MTILAFQVQTRIVQCQILDFAIGQCLIKNRNFRHIPFHCPQFMTFPVPQNQRRILFLNRVDVIEFLGRNFLAVQEAGNRVIAVAASRFVRIGNRHGIMNPGPRFHFHPAAVQQPLSLQILEAAEHGAGIIARKQQGFTFADHVLTDYFPVVETDNTGEGDAFFRQIEFFAAGNDGTAVFTVEADIILSAHRPVFQNHVGVFGKIIVIDRLFGGKSQTAPQSQSKTNELLHVILPLRRSAELQTTVHPAVSI